MQWLRGDAGRGKCVLTLGCFVACSEPYTACGSLRGLPGAAHQRNKIFVLPCLIQAYDEIGKAPARHKSRKALQVTLFFADVEELVATETSCSELELSDEHVRICDER